MSGALNPRDRSWHPPALTPDYRTSRLRSPNQKLIKLPSTISEETGPVFGQDELGKNDANLIENFAAPGKLAIGPRILIHGRLADEDGRGIGGALIEVWQANAGGRYRHVNEGYLAPLDDNFGGCGRTITDDHGHYEFLTIRPGPYPWPNHENAWRPAHVHFSVFGHSFGQRLITQMYFEGDPLIPLCPIVQAIPLDDAVHRLIAHQDIARAKSMDHLAYRFDLVLRGQNQTYFENKPEGA